MIDERELFERAALRFDPPQGELARLMRRRDRKRRNQRLAAGVVGLAIGAAVVLAGISITRSDRSPAAPSPVPIWRNGDISVKTSRGIEAIDPSTGRGRVVLKNSSAEVADWSPDGTKLAYIVKSPSGSLSSLRIWDEQTGTSQQVYSCSLQCGFLSLAAVDWSPDGSRIAFRFGPSGLYVIGADGSHLVKISDGVRARSPSWSPAGDQLAFSSDQGIFVVGADGSRPTFLAAGSDPAWSPDGRTIAFVRDPSDSNAQPSHYVAQIWLIHPDGSGINEVFELSGCCTSAWGGPAWSPDGKKLAFVFGHGLPRLYITNSDGSDLQVWGHLSVRGHVWPVRPSWQPVP